MATRFYLPGGGSAPISPAFDAGWEQTGSAIRFPLVYKGAREKVITVNNTTQTIPITTTQDVLNAQFVSSPIRRQLIAGTFSLVIRVGQTASTTNCTLAVVVRVVSQDGGTVRGTLFSVFGTDTAWALAATPDTRIVNAQAVTPLVVEAGDRIVVEIGATATAPSTSNTEVMRAVNDTATADYALTSGLTTSLNPWCEFSQDLFTGNTPNRGLRPHPFSPGLAR